MNVFGRGFDSRRLQNIFMRLGRKRKSVRSIAPFIFLLLLVVFSPALTKNLLKISGLNLPGGSRVDIESSFPLTFSLEQNGSFLFVHIQTKSSFQIQQGRIESGFIKSSGWSKGSEGYTLVIETQSASFRHEATTRSDLLQVSIVLSGADGNQPAASVPPADSNVESQEVKTQEIQSPAQEPEEKKAEVKKATEPPVRPPVQPEATAPFPEKAAALSFASKKIKTIVIDPGHGGLETGAKGKFGALEKDVTLVISQKLKALIERNLACRVVLARDKDVDVSLDSRAAIANNNKADLFISVHANGSYQKKAHGSETFFLSAVAPDEETRKLAYMENNSHELEGRIEKEEQDEVKLILWDLAQTAYLKESSRLAEIIQNDLNDLLGTANRGIKQAPFKVLTAVACPAVLVEVAFISNPEEEKKLVDEGFQNRVAEAIFRGLQSYLKLYPRG